MLVYFRNLSLLLILSCIFCFLALVGALACLLCIVLAPLLAFHIKKLINFSITTENYTNENI